MSGEVGRPPIDRSAEWIPADQLTEPAGWLGVDIGFIYPAADSDGVIYKWANSRRRDSAHRDFAEAGPVRIRRTDGSVSIRRAYDGSELADIGTRAHDDGFNARLQTISLVIVKKARESDRGLALEDWTDLSRRRSPYLWLYRRLLYDADATGVAVRTVARAWTSQTCPDCGHCSRSNRPTRGQFRCEKCGRSGQSDVMAATNIAQMGERELSIRSDRLRHCQNPSCTSWNVWRGGYCCACYFWKRRRGRLPSEEQIERLVSARNYAAFKRELEADPWIDQRNQVS